LVVTRYSDYAGAPRELLRHSVPALAVTVVLTGAWIGIHTSWERSARRFEQILEFDATHASYAYENLALLYEEKGRMGDAIDHMQSALRASKSPRQALRLSQYYEKIGRRDWAIASMQSVLRELPEDDDARAWLILLLERNEQYSEILPLAREGAQMHPGRSLYWFYVGEASAALGDTASAIEGFLRARELNPPPTARQRIEEQLGRLAPGP